MKILAFIAAVIGAYMFGCHRGWVNQIDHREYQDAVAAETERQKLLEILDEKPYWATQ